MFDDEENKNDESIRDEPPRQDTSDELEHKIAAQVTMWHEASHPEPEKTENSDSDGDNTPEANTR